MTIATGDDRVDQNWCHERMAEGELDPDIPDYFPGIRTYPA